MDTHRPGELRNTLVELSKVKLTISKTGGGPSSTKEKPSGAWEPSQVADHLYKKMEEGKFYVICPDNEVTEEKDKRRVLWAAREITSGQPPLSRWREDQKEEAEKWIGAADLSQF